MNITLYIHWLTNKYTWWYIHRLTDEHTNLTNECTISYRSPNLFPARPTVASASSLQTIFDSAPPLPSGPPPSTHRVMLTLAQSWPLLRRRPLCRAGLHPPCHRRPTLPPPPPVTIRRHPRGRRPLTPWPLTPLRLRCLETSVWSVVPLCPRHAAAAPASGELTGAQ
jgi:hypothetical protein